VEDIDHSRTKTKSPQTNRIAERFHKTVLDEFYRIVFRKRLYASIEDLEAITLMTDDNELTLSGLLEGASRGDLFPEQEAGHRCSAGKARARGQAPRRRRFREQNIVEKLARAFRPGEGKRVRSCVVARNF
jgi:hypothetical protein